MAARPGQFQKGQKRPANAGRRAGTPNKLTTSAKAALHEAFVELGGVPALVRWGKKAPTEFYKIWARLVPLEVTGEGGQPLFQTIVYTPAKDDGGHPPA